MRVLRTCITSFPLFPLMVETVIQPKLTIPLYSPAARVTVLLITSCRNGRVGPHSRTEDRESWLRCGSMETQYVPALSPEKE